PGVPTDPGEDPGTVGGFPGLAAPPRAPRLQAHGGTERPVPGARGPGAQEPGTQHQAGAPGRRERHGKGGQGASGDQPEARRGRLMVKVEPSPGALATRMTPPCCMMIPLQTARPQPALMPNSRVVK